MAGRGFDCASGRHAESIVLNRWCRSIGACEPVAQKKSSAKSSALTESRVEGLFRNRHLPGATDSLGAVAGKTEQARPPRHPDHQGTVTCPKRDALWGSPQGDVQLMAEKKVLKFKP